jgi:hypothetical protein
VLAKSKKEEEEEDVCIVELDKGNCPFEAVIQKTDYWRVNYLNSCHNHCLKKPF